MFTDLLHWFVHDARIWVTDTARTYPYWCFPIAFGVAFSESFAGISVLVPGFALLLGLGAVCGDWISWWLGRHYHHQILHVWPFRKFEAQIEKALHFFHRWGAWAVFFGRFLGPLRASVPLVAGMSELEFRPFMIASVISALIWAYALLAFPALVTSIFTLSH